MRVDHAIATAGVRIRPMGHLESAAQVHHARQAAVSIRAQEREVGLAESPKRRSAQEDACGRGAAPAVPIRKRQAAEIAHVVDVPERELAAIGRGRQRMRVAGTGSSDPFWLRFHSRLLRDAIGAPRPSPKRLFVAYMVAPPSTRFLTECLRLAEGRCERWARTATT